MSFYKAVALIARAFADLAQNLTEAGYSDAEAATVQKEVEFYVEIRAAIKKHSGEELRRASIICEPKRLHGDYMDWFGSRPVSSS